MDEAGSRGRRRVRPIARLALLLVATSLVAFVLVPQGARAPSPLPMNTQGMAYDRSGSPLPAGTLIRTFVDGVDYSNDTTVVNAAGAFFVLTNGSLVLNQTTPEPSPWKTGASAGELVLYAAGTFATTVDVFQEVLAWHTDLNVTQDLHLGSAQTTPAALRIQGLVTQPAQGGPQYVFVCNPTTANVSLADYYLQVDRPGTYFGGNFTLTGTVGPDAQERVNLSSAFPLNVTGDALKLVYRNPAGASASAGGRDFVIDRLEYNAASGGTLDWQPGNTTMGNAPAPGPGQILERSPFCSATPAPRSFQLAVEPGLPPSGPPTVTILSPTPGQSVQGGGPFTIRWTLSDPVFIPAYLRVWVNVTYQGTTTSLLSGTPGVTALDWSVPDVGAIPATVSVTAVDPFGGTGNATAAFNLLPATPYSAYIAIIIVVVIAVFIIVAFYYARRPSGPAPGPPPAAGPPAAGPPSEAGTAPAASEAARTKVCPECGTQVRETDGSCFYCGHLFVKPP